jgi:two-component system phosphate regulon sensor histidine kinase PhoR
MDTAFMFGVIGVSFAAVMLLLMRVRRLTNELDALSDQHRQLRQQCDALAREATECCALKDALSEAIFDPLLVIDGQRRIMAGNEIAKRLGLCKAGQTLIEAIRSHELDSLAGDALNARCELPRDFYIDQRLFRARAVRYNGGAVLVLRDISELQRLGRARRDFVANISHELRTPLATIGLLLESLRLEAAAIPPNPQRLIAHMDAQVTSLTQLVQELSDLAQIEAGQVPMRMVRASLYQVANTVIHRLLPQAESAGLRLVNEIPEHLYGLFDPAQIQRVLSNLLHNAIKFTPAGGATVFVLSAQEAVAQLAKLRVALAEVDLTPEDVWVVGVRDTGVGIPREELPRIFERFYKVDRARGQGGSGLGLAIAKHIVEAHGGRIWAESTVGKGTTFYFTVPREE